ncbi:14-3-3-like protein [Teleopsis dalmanni]|uniref:14-3-3-like protein n=1 Tax=Teleopsis dalmanni TaxID=139649 RepID=UPI0018CE2979|nr:14-3-3-like protein [Teleopsis dalmanni]XP_037929471.1 14-3-3-like protein [Teleopsis dalmanni]
MDFYDIDLRNMLVNRIVKSDQNKNYDEMIVAVKNLIGCDPEFSNDELYWLSLAYKSVINKRRNSLNKAKKLLNGEKQLGNIGNIKKAESLCNQIKTEIRLHCLEILRLLDTKLLPNAVTEEAKVICLKLKGDFHRYLMEFEKGTNLELSKQNAYCSYSSAQKLASKKLTITNPIRLALMINHSLFEHDFLQNHEYACCIAKKAHDKALEEINKQGDDTQTKDAVAILQLLLFNLLLWEDASEEQEKSADGKSAALKKKT